jgi:hypothetical protein
MEMVDSETGTTWDFQGRRFGGALVGKQLEALNCLRTTGSTGRPITPKRHLLARAVS